MLHYPQIDPVAVSLGPVKIHWYGLTYLFGIVAGYLLARYRSSQQDCNWHVDEIDSLLFYLVLGVIAGGRIGSVLLYNPGTFLLDPLIIVRTWQGGMSFHGGLIGVIIALGLYARHSRRRYFDVADFIAPMFPIGLGAGRIGNFINGELWGRTTDLPWGMVFSHVDLQPRHPSQLYQFFGEAVLLFWVLWWFSRKNRPRMAVSGFFLLFYGIYRVLIEFLREPDQSHGFVAFDWLTMGQLLSVPMIAIGAGLLIVAYTDYKIADRC